MAKLCGSVVVSNGAHDVGEISYEIHNEVYDHRYSRWTTTSKSKYAAGQLLTDLMKCPFVIDANDASAFPYYYNKLRNSKNVKIKSNAMKFS